MWQDEERWKRHKAAFESMLFDEIIYRTKEPELLGKFGFIWEENEALQNALAGDLAE